MSVLWELADQFEDRSKDTRHYGPLQRYIWRKAWEELVERLGSRNV